MKVIFENKRSGVVREVWCSGFVQLTNIELRVGPEGKAIAFLLTDEDVWITVDDHQVWTDAIITGEEE